MVSIGEFAHAVKLNVKTLRFYHDLKILIPAKVDDETGYRYYDKASFTRVQSILLLKELGFTLKEIQEIFENCSDEDDLSPFIEQKISDVEHKIRKLREINNQLYRQKNTAVASKQDSEGIIEFEFFLPSYVSKRFSGTYDQVGEAFSQLYERYGRLAKGKPYAFYYELGYSDEPTDIECGIEIEGKTKEIFPKTKAVKLIHEGPYGSQGSSYFNLFSYCRERDYSVKLPVVEHFIKGPGLIFPGNPKKYRTECIILLEEK